MIYAAQRFGSAAAVALVLGLLNLLSSSEPFAQGQPDCTVTVKPGESIQKAIDEAKEGAVICLGAGYFFESLVIKKNLTLRGIPYAGHLRNPKNEKAVISIQSDNQITVLIENISITVDASGQPGVVGIYATGQTKAILQNTTIQGIAYGFIPDMSWMSLAADGSAQVEVIDSRLTGDGYGLGIWLAKSAYLSVKNSTISGYPQGITATMDARVSVENSVLSKNILAFAAWEWHNQMDIQQISVIGNTYGFRIGGKGRLTISRSRILGNEVSGLMVFEVTDVRIKESLIMGNGTHPRCWETGAAGWWEEKICNGIELSEEAQLVLSDSNITSNADWAIAARREECGYIPDRFNGFRGKVSFLGKNTIEGNNKSSNQNGMGNPGNHPWNHPDVPDGQVCLP